MHKAAAKLEQAELAKTEAKDDRRCHAVRTLEQWYLLDENAKPFGRTDLLGEYVFRSRVRKIDGIDYGKETDHDGKPTNKDTQAWLDVQFVLWSIVNRAFPATLLAQRFSSAPEHDAEFIQSIIRFQASATTCSLAFGTLRAPCQISCSVADA